MRRRKPARGYALTLMLVLLVTGSLYAIVSRLDSSTLQAARTAETARALQQARAALLAYALTYRESHPDEATAVKVAGYGYLPCPDLSNDDGIGMLGTAAGNCGANGTLSIGLLPYRSLGLPDLRDGDGNCLWYAVSGTHKNNPNPNPLNWDTRGQIEILDANGNTLLNAGNAAGGAVAVVISPGPAIDNAAVRQSASRAYKDKPCGTDSAQAAAYLESLAAKMYSGMRRAADGSTVSNDTLAWLSAAELFVAIRKRETEFPGYINTALTDLAGVLNRNYAANNPGSGSRLTAQLVINDLVSTDPIKQSAQNFARQWSDHLWFRKCTTGCTVFGASCAGVLIWSGSGAATPRTGADYLEAGARNLMSNGASNLSTLDAGASYVLETPTKDVALCLNPT